MVSRIAISAQLTFSHRLLAPFEKNMGLPQTMGLPKNNLKKCVNTIKQVQGLNMTDRLIKSGPSDCPFIPLRPRSLAN